MFLIELLIITWFSLQPLLAIGYVAFLLFGPENFIFYFVFIGIPSEIMAIVLSAKQIARKFLETTKINSFFFFLQQIGASLIEAYIFRRDPLEDYFKNTLTFDFTILSIITFFELKSFLENFGNKGKFFLIISYFFIFVFHSLILMYFYFQNIQDTEKITKSVSFVIIVFSQIANYLLIKKKKSN